MKIDLCLNADMEKKLKNVVDRRWHPNFIMLNILHLTRSGVVRILSMEGSKFQNYFHISFSSSTEKVRTNLIAVIENKMWRLGP